MHNNRLDHTIITPQDRAQLNGHPSAVIWFTGLSGAGKSTLAYTLEKELYQRKIRTFVLDGDNFRRGLSSDLSYSAQDRSENIRRAKELSLMMSAAGLFVLAALISPFAKDRNMVRKAFVDTHFIEVYCRAALAVCESRDLKGLYKCARTHGTPDFTGISSPYEEPENPDITLDTDKISVQEATDKLIAYLQEKNLIT